MPLRLLERVLPWLVSEFTESEARAFPHNMCFAAPSSDFVLMTLFYGWACKGRTPDISDCYKFQCSSPEVTIGCYLLEDKNERVAACHIPKLGIDGSNNFGISSLASGKVLRTSNIIILFGVRANSVAVNDHPRRKKELVAAIAFQNRLPMQPYKEPLNGCFPVIINPAKTECLSQKEKGIHEQDRGAQAADNQRTVQLTREKCSSLSISTKVRRKKQSEQTKGVFQPEIINENSVQLNVNGVITPLIKPSVEITNRCQIMNRNSKNQTFNAFRKENSNKNANSQVFHSYGGSQNYDSRLSGVSSSCFYFYFLAQERYFSNQILESVFPQSNMKIRVKEREKTGKKKIIRKVIMEGRRYTCSLCVRGGETQLRLWLGNGRRHFGLKATIKAVEWEQGRASSSSLRPSNRVTAKCCKSRNAGAQGGQSVKLGPQERIQDNSRSDRIGSSQKSTSSLSSTCLRVEGKRGRAREREGEICEGEFVREFTKVAPSKGSVHLLRASSQIFEGLGGVHFSEKRWFSAGFGWKQKEVRFSASFRRKRKESKVLCLTGLLSSDHPTPTTKNSTFGHIVLDDTSRRPGRYDRIMTIIFPEPLTVSIIGHRPGRFTLSSWTIHVSVRLTPRDKCLCLIVLDDT
ncbi:hypothetical protein M5K25_012702 [Dendrobium thyrsiflorum]|uniref:Uncharacterized protein n=1 Tax=Dendrobium thyrsiflorum TaxID=117978 RepID=A0ABD0UXT0_DENTH